MQVFGVFVSWIKKTPESKSYPTYEETAQATEQSPAPLYQWKLAMTAAAAYVNTHPAYLFYNRLEEENGDVYTLSYYTSAEEYAAMVAARPELFEAVTVARANLAEFLGLNVTVKHTTLDVGAVDYTSVTDVKAYMDSIEIVD